MRTRPSAAPCQSRITPSGVGQRLVVGEPAAYPLPVLPVGAIPGHGDVRDERVGRADTEDDAHPGTRVGLGVLDGVDRVVEPGGGRADDRGAGRNAEADSLRCGEARFGVPPLRRRPVPVEITGGPTVHRVEDATDQSVPGVAVGVDQAGHDHLAPGVDRLPGGVPPAQIVAGADRDDPVARDRHATAVDDGSGVVHRDDGPIEDQQVDQLGHVAAPPDGRIDRLATGREDSNHLDFEQDIGSAERRDDQAGVRGPMLSEEALALGRYRRGVGGVDQVGRHLDDVVGSASGCLQDRPEVGVDLLGLAGRVARCDQFAVHVTGDLPGDVDRVPGTHGVVVAGGAVDAFRLVSLEERLCCSPSTPLVLHLRRELNGTLNP